MLAFAVLLECNIFVVFPILSVCFDSVALFKLLWIKAL